MKNLRLDVCFLRISFLEEFKNKNKNDLSLTTLYMLHLANAAHALRRHASIQNWSLSLAIQALGLSGWVCVSLIRYD